MTQSVALDLQDLDTLDTKDASDSTDRNLKSAYVAAQTALFACADVKAAGAGKYLMPSRIVGSVRPPTSASRAAARVIYEGLIDDIQASLAAAIASFKTEIYNTDLDPTSGQSFTP